MNEIKKFASEKFGEIRTVIIDDEPWFVGKDVAAALGYADTVNALKAHVDAEDKGGWQITTPSGAQQMTIINESGLYALILSSRLESAREFKRWVTHEVLPSIRRTGTYSASPQLKTAPLPPESASGVAKLITVIRLVMRDNGQPPEAVSQAVKGLCEQFGVILPANFVRESPFEQLGFNHLKGAVL